MASPRFPEPPASIPPTTIDKLDAVVAAVSSKKDEWVKVSVAERIKLLEKIRDDLIAEAPSWANTISQLKGLSSSESLHGEDWLAGPITTMRNVQQLIAALKEGGQPKPPKLTQRKDGQWVAEVLPWNMYDKLIFTGWRAEVWIEPGQPPSQGRIYREKQQHGKTALVLAAGNVTSIGTMDLLNKLFVENEVVVMKMNPVNEAGGPHIEKIFKALIDKNYAAVVYGGGDVGKHLTDHAHIDTIHITGSDKTHDAIIWGVGDEQEKNKKAGTPRLNKHISSELGCVTPVLVLPGPWSAADIAHQGEQIAGMVAQNGSFNCNAAKILVTWKDWPLRDQLLAAVEEALRKAKPRKAYYPGAEQRYTAFTDKYPNHKVIGVTGEGIVPWTLLPNVPPHKGEYALTTEAFCGVLADTALDASDASDFIDKAKDFANDVCWGTLSCMVIAHPDTQKSPKFDGLIAGLRYGGIAINGWAGAIYGLCQTTWGAYPGHPLDDIQSGRGVVHNTFLFDHPQKSVMYLPWRIMPKAVWSPAHKTLDKTAKALFNVEAQPSMLRIAPLLAAAVRG